MREFKFRAWVKGPRMVYNVVPFSWDYCISTMSHKCVKSNGPGILGSGGTEATFELEGFAYNGDSKKCLMQFTGRKDKNNKEIYEGDIVNIIAPFEADENHPNTKKWIVEYNDKEGGYVIEWNNMFYEGSDLTLPGWAGDQDFGFEIIGNIHENPELL